MKDFYYILGTNRDSTPDELNAAYRKLAQKLQPAGQEQDDFLDSHFEEITEAYIVLSDPVRKQKYDAAYKKNYQRRLYYFKIRHLNVAAMLALVGFTALFGYYVINSLKSKKPVRQAKAEVVEPTPTKRHRKSKLKNIPAAKYTPTKAVKVTDVVFKPAAKTQTVITKPLQSLPAPVHQEPVKQIPVPQAATAPTENGNTYTTELLANVTGLVYLHQTANYRSPVLASIPNHAKVQVLERGGSFYKIAFQNQTGYVPKWTVANP